MCHALNEVHLKIGLGRHAFSESLHWILRSFNTALCFRSEEQKSTIRLKLRLIRYRMVHFQEMLCSKSDMEQKLSIVSIR